MEFNPFIGKNYFPGVGGIETPPAHFLQRVYDYDALLVLFPSQKLPGAYVIARRREMTAGLTGGAVIDYIDQPDTKTCIAMGWVPVCVMYHTGLGWNADTVIAKLKARDLRAQGGADKVADALEAQEDADVKAQQAATRDDLYNRSGDAWRSYQHRTGQSTIRSKDFLPSPPPEAADPTASTPRSTAGSGTEIPSV